MMELAPLSCITWTERVLILNSTKGEVTHIKTRHYSTELIISFLKSAEAGLPEGILLQYILSKYNRRTCVTDNK